jgi:Cys-tRNA(Pro)/Cys-tRNA(Cys) deacylase
MDEPKSPATQALHALGIPFTVHCHAHPVRTLEQAARERGLTPDQILRSLLFRLDDGSFVMVLMPGRNRVSWPRLRRHLGVSRVTTATPQEVLRVTGFAPGTVTPFGLRQPVRLLADTRVMQLTQVSLGAGLPDAGLILQRADLVRALNPEIVRLSDDSPPSAT